MGKGQGLLEPFLFIGGALVVASIVLSVLISSYDLSGQPKLTRTELAKQFCPTGYVNDGGSFSWDQYCQGKAMNCSTKDQKCYYKQLQENLE